LFQNFHKCLPTLTNFYKSKDEWYHPNMYLYRGTHYFIIYIYFWKEPFDKQMRPTIFDDLHEVMYMSIKPYEGIESFKDCGKKKWLKALNNISRWWIMDNIFGLLLSIWYVNALSLLDCCSWLSYISKKFHPFSYFENNPTYVLSCIVCVVVELWMIDLRQLSHSNQNT